MGAGRRSAWLGLAQALELGLQILLPVLLVRHLSATGFADYRRAWLIAGTAASLLPFAMPDALSLILPRASAIERGAHVRLVFTYLAVIGASAGFCTFWALSMAGAQTAPFARAALIGLFVALWVPGVLLDYLPVADERGDWQAKRIMVLAVFRTVLTGWAVLTWNELDPVLACLSAVSAMRLAVVAIYAQQRHGWLGARVRRQDWRRHIDVAAPMGLNDTLSTLRRQGDQWIAAALFSAVQFASFSLASVASPIVLLLRRALSTTLLPVMAREHAGGNIAAVLATNQRANTAVACVGLPVLSFLWWFADPLYDFVYTPVYRDAVPVVRLLVVTWLCQIVELNSVVVLTGLMPRAVRLNAALTIASIGVAVVGGLWLGLVGVACGGVLVAVTERWLIVRMLAKTLNLSWRQVQPWRALVGIVVCCLSLAAIGRLGFSLRPAGMPQWLAMAIVTLVLPWPYLLIVRRMGWWPKKLESA